MYPRLASLDGPAYENEAFPLNEFGHQGLMHDETTGLIYNRARFRNHDRFLQRDPLGYPDGVNAYAGYNLLYESLDPLGLSTYTNPGVHNGVPGTYYHYYNGHHFNAWRQEEYLWTTFVPKVDVAHSDDDQGRDIDETLTMLGNRNATVVGQLHQGATVATEGAAAVYAAATLILPGVDDAIIGAALSLKGLKLVRCGGEWLLKKGDEIIAKGDDALKAAKKAVDDFTGLGKKTKDKLHKSATEAKGKGDFSRAGHSLTKHGQGAREGNSKFPAAKGNPADVNAAAEEIVEDILNDPGTVIKPKRGGRQADGGFEVIAPDGRGMTYDKDGNFIYFME